MWIFGNFLIWPASITTLFGPSEYMLVQRYIGRPEIAPDLLKLNSVGSRADVIHRIGNRQYVDLAWCLHGPNCPIFRFPFRVALCSWFA